MLVTKYIIDFKNITLFMPIGFWSKEQKLGQRIHTDIQLTLKEQSYSFNDSDNLSGVYDYSRVPKIFLETAKQKTYRLLEDLAVSFAKALFVDKNIMEIYLVIRKPSAPVNAVLDYIALNMTFKNE